MVVHRAAAVAAGHQLITHGVHLGALAEVEGEVGAGGRVVRAEQGDALAAGGPLQIAPVGRFPGEPQAQAGIEGLGALHVLHPQGHVAEPVLRAPRLSAARRCVPRCAICCALRCSLHQHSCVLTIVRRWRARVANGVGRRQSLGMR